MLEEFKQTVKVMLICIALAGVILVSLIILTI